VEHIVTAKDIDAGKDVDNSPFEDCMQAGVERHCCAYVCDNGDRGRKAQREL
jgi:hypothetical protein